MKKVFFHVGLAKTATSFLQENVFPDSSFCYLGKSSTSWARKIIEKDPWLFIRFLQEREPGLDSFDLAKKLNGPGRRYYNYYLDIISRHEAFLVSDEMYTVNPMTRNLRSLIPVMYRCHESIMHKSFESFDLDSLSCFEAGIHLADSAWNG